MEFQQNKQASAFKFNKRLGQHANSLGNRAKHCVKLAIFSQWWVSIFSIQYTQPQWDGQAELA